MTNQDVSADVNRIGCLYPSETSRPDRPDAKELVDDPLLKPKPGFEKTLSVFA
jgi:hypothetical protein